jgi:hypothetical protein
MRHAIIMSSQLGPIDGYSCWLPIRFTGQCQKCKRFNICPLPEPMNKRYAKEILFGVKENDIWDIEE